MLEDDSELKNGNLSGANKSSHRLGDNQQANLSHSTLERLESRHQVHLTAGVMDRIENTD